MFQGKWKKKQRRDEEEISSIALENNKEGVKERLWAMELKIELHKESIKHNIEVCGFLEIELEEINLVNDFKRNTKVLFTIKKSDKQVTYFKA